MVRSKKDAGEQGAPMWIVTFSDLMSLLLTFFILLLSFSTISEEKFNRAAMSLQGAFGVLKLSDSVVAPIPKPRKRRDEEQAKAARELQRRMQVSEREKQVKIEYDAVGGLKISLPTAALFELGSSVLRPEAFPIFQDMAEVLGELPGAFIEVRGHTDATPLSDTTRFRDNYDLSYSRAKAVTMRLNRVGDVPLEQFEIVALGPSQPLATNDTEEGKMANRRVEIFVRGLVEQAKIEPLQEEMRGLTGFEASPSLPSSPEEFTESR